MYLIITMGCHCEWSEAVALTPVKGCLRKGEDGNPEGAQPCAPTSGLPVARGILGGTGIYAISGSDRSLAERRMPVVGRLDPILGPDGLPRTRDWIPASAHSR